MKVRKVMFYSGKPLYNDWIKYIYSEYAKTSII